MCIAILECSSSKHINFLFFKYEKYSHESMENILLANITIFKGKKRSFLLTNQTLKFVLIEENNLHKNILSHSKDFRK
jgi:hypothetical protein